MFCSNCGKEIDDNSTTCNFCGIEIKSEQNHGMEVINTTFSILLCAITAYAVITAQYYDLVFLYFIFALILDKNISAKIQKKFKIKNFKEIRLYILMISIFLFCNFVFLVLNKPKTIPISPDFSNIISSYDNPMDNYYKNDFKDEVQKYNMAIQQNDKMHACWAAYGAANAAYELKDNKNYNKWETIRKKVCDF